MHGAEALSRPVWQEAWLLHHLQLAGLSADPCGVEVCIRHQLDYLSDQACGFVRQGGVLVLTLPGPGALAQLGLYLSTCERAGSHDLAYIALSGAARTLRTYNLRQVFSGAGQAILPTIDGNSLWRKVHLGAGQVIVVGTDLAADLLLYRQGDPTAAHCRPEGGMWGIAGERPVYLFEQQLKGLSRADERQADLWIWQLRQVLIDSGVRFGPVLPHDSPGAIVITGDDDQAELARYQEQLDLIGDVPITYLMHPLTKHTPRTIRRMFARHHVSMGLHPDALDSPGDYARLFKHQARWFRSLTGYSPTSLRNHGFLNDGYWGHLPAWLDADVRISSNLPGFDGRPLNGSFLPARLVWNDDLTNHWSVVTAIGDGIRTINGGQSDEACARCVFDAADTIRGSGIPGVLVLNLHPQNVSTTRLMHLAALELTQSGFLAWSLDDCVRWFGHREMPVRRSRTAGWRGWIERWGSFKVVRNEQGI